MRHCLSSSTPVFISNSLFSKPCSPPVLLVGITVAMQNTHHHAHLIELQAQQRLTSTCNGIANSWLVRVAGTGWDTGTSDRSGRCLGMPRIVQHFCSVLAHVLLLIV